ncbi:MAG TPA: hypothetical protein VLD57_04850 [Blastocatellia bacterium]|nr:hypothetical protein [Blastocatellia bacterium]
MNSRYRRPHQVISATLCFTALTFLMACGGKPFNVQPRPTGPAVISGAGTEVGGLTVQAEAVTDEATLYDTYDANLILAGILPVRVRLTNSRTEPFEIKRARFEVRSASNRKYRAMDAGRAYKRLISYYGISTYSKSGYKESRTDFESYGLDTSQPLGAGESRQGILFFAVPDEEIRGGGLTLICSRLDARKSGSKANVEIRLD